jgi:hypothetical protein
MKRDRPLKSADGFTRKRGGTLAADLDLLLGDLCAKWGFCNRLTGTELASLTDGLTPDAFADAVLRAEGFSEPSLELDWRRKLERLFADRYGASVSSADYGPG